MDSERRKDCPMRHPDNGNCLPAGGFCTAVNNIICDAMHSAFLCGYVSASEKYTEVVRCKDCRFCKKHPTSDKVKMCTNEQQWVTECYPLVHDNDFCSYGERREEE